MKSLTHVPKFPIANGAFTIDQANVAMSVNLMRVRLLGRPDSIAGSMMPGMNFVSTAAVKVSALASNL
jgi:hypothetical protein